jgi:DNA modification methylase
MQLLHENIGTAKDNLKSPVHSWYKFTAGFSYKLIDTLVESNELNTESVIFEPFAGCGTTLVQAQKKQIRAIGNEGQTFMYEIIKAKLNWNFDDGIIHKKIISIVKFVKENKLKVDSQSVNPLLITLYTPKNLEQLLSIKSYIEGLEDEEIYLFFKLALSQTLHKCSIHPISAPYISRSKILQDIECVEAFYKIACGMLSDLSTLKNLSKTSNIYLQDSRILNPQIKDESCDVCITSPPYLNNLDYGEVSKVQSHFFGITSNWNDITQNVRKNLVTASTTHYSENKFSLDDWKKSEFYQNNVEVAEQLIQYSKEIISNRKDRKGNKSFDIMMFLYFQDMYYVIKEIKRVLKNGGKTFMVLGDSAPYGVFIPTTDLLGEISKSVGFESYEKIKIRTRGTKWKTLRHRHSIELDENILILN